MPIRRLTVAAGLAAVLLLLGAASISLAAGMMFREASLTQGGMAYEVNADAAGNLFISDSNAGEIWQLHAASSAYTKYLGLPNPSDARPDRMGNIWWVDWRATTIGRINVLSDTVTTWEIEPSQNLQTFFGLALDGADHVWLSTRSYYPTGAVLYRFDPQTAELCGYGWEGGSNSDYVLYAEGRVWLGDRRRQRIIRFDPAAAQDQVRWWSLAGGSSPEGLALDGVGHFWWADPGTDVVASLDPGNDRVTTRRLPAGHQPEMLTLEGGRVWYTTLSGSVGALAPALASGTAVTATTGLLNASASCDTIEEVITTTVFTAQGTLAWGSPSELAPVVDGNGWTIYQFPSGAALWGIVVSSGSLLASDNGRQKLVRLDAAGPSRTFLPLVIR